MAWLPRLARLLPAVLLLASAPGPAARAAVPVLCSDGVAAGASAVLSCRRQDTGASFTAVPTGEFLHVTDVVFTRNNLATSGEFYVTLGRESGSTLPAAPSFNTSGTPLRTQSLRFRTPVVVLGAGEELAVRNDASSDFPIDVYTSGYLAPRVLVPEPRANALAATALGALALLGARRRRREDAECA